MADAIPPMEPAPTPLLSLAEVEALARRVHSGQTDKAGRPYAEHLAAVATGVRERGGSDEQIAAAWLHDAVEDGALSEEWLAGAALGEPVKAMILAVTKRAGEPVEEYTARILATPGALLVKEADLAHNADPGRLAVLDAPTRERLTAKYARVRALLGLSAPRPAPGAGRVIAALEGVGVLRHATGQLILDAVDWTVRAGEHWALLGANGAGKTTLLRLVGALMFPTVGTVEVLGHRLGSVDVRELRAVIGLVSGAQKVPQDATGHTVVLTGATGTVQPLWRKYGAETRERAHELLTELDCKELADRPFGVCSGGQRARILIARALMAEPRLLLLDEPFNALDLPSREDLIDTLHQLAASRPELATVTVTHHLEELSPAVDRALLLRDGRVQARGPVDEVLTGERMTACFGRPIEVSRHEGRLLARSGRR